LILYKLSWRKWLRLSACTGLLCGLLYLPLIEWTYADKLANGALLYFSHFEFNASFYYVLKSIYLAFEPFQSGRIISQCLGVLTLFTLLLMYKWKHWSFPQMLLVFYSVYLLLSAVVHPWYIIPLVSYAILTGYWTPIVWSFLVFISYTHYSTPTYQENFYAIAIEYLGLMSSFLIELYLRKRKAIVTPVTE